MSRLGGSLPIVVESEGWEATAEEVDDIFIGDAGTLPLMHQAPNLCASRLVLPDNTFLALINPCISNYKNEF